jgi:cellulose 1,4-beta-cellobiosidase
VILSGLLADTTYYYVITATDASGNTSTSTERSLKTLVAPDTTAPTIASLTAAAITSGSATVSWTTNESATGKVKYDTASPPLANILENTALTLNHTFNLTGLTASTTYHYIVSSTDSAGNTSNSAELTFTTL